MKALLLYFMLIATSIQAQSQKGLYADNSSQALNLSPILNEISGITYYKGQLLAIQDEQGTLYTLSTKNGSIIDSFTFNKKGDFEALTSSKNTIWAYETKGNLWEIEYFNESTKTKINKYHTPFSKINDVEGIAYDAENNQLLMACKESPLLGDEAYTIKDSKYIYAFDLESKTLNNSPIIQYNFETIQLFLAANPSTILHPKVQKSLNKGKKLNLKPTDIAIHPLTQDIFILCGTAYSILVFSAKNYALKAIYSLDDSIFNQAEGLTFLPNGDFYISTEKDKIKDKEEENFEKGSSVLVKEKARNGRIYFYKSHILGY